MLPGNSQFPNPNPPRPIGPVKPPVGTINPVKPPTPVNTNAPKTTMPMPKNTNAPKEISPLVGTLSGPFHKPSMPRNGQPMGTFSGANKPNTKSGQPTGTFSGNTAPGMKPKNGRLMGQLNK